MKRTNILRYAFLLVIALAAAALTMYFTEADSYLAYLGWFVFYIAINTPLFMGKSPSQCPGLKRSTKQ
jgi:hypothetical protein